MKVFLPEIRHDRTGFECLVRLNAETAECAFESVEIDMATTEWFDADMCAPFGALLYRISSELNTISLTSIRPHVAKILSKNGFLTNYGGVRLHDRWGTTIPYRRFDVKDDRYFAGYIEDELIHRAEMPKMSTSLAKKFRESVFEIFSNSVIHSQSKLGIFSCGQFFPKRHRLDFAVADLGIGIKKNVEDNAGLSLSPEQAIMWATEGQNTTKRGPIPGGLGLKLLREFVRLNGGRIQIVSDRGYWCQEKAEVSTAVLAFPFPGTVVSVEINTSDSQSYMLVSEVLDESQIF